MWTFLGTQGLQLEKRKYEKYFLVESSNNPNLGSHKSWVPFVDFPLTLMFELCLTFECELFEGVVYFINCNCTLFVKLKTTLSHMPHIKMLPFSTILVHILVTITCYTTSINVTNLKRNLEFMTHTKYSISWQILFHCILNFVLFLTDSLSCSKLRKKIKLWVLNNHMKECFNLIILRVIQKIYNKICITIHTTQKI